MCITKERDANALKYDDLNRIKEKKIKNKR